MLLITTTSARQLRRQSYNFAKVYGLYRKRERIRGLQSNPYNTIILFLFAFSLSPRPSPVVWFLTPVIHKSFVCRGRELFLKSSCLLKHVLDRLQKRVVSGCAMPLFHEKFRCTRRSNVAARENPLPSPLLFFLSLRCIFPPLEPLFRFTCFSKCISPRFSLSCSSCVPCLNFSTCSLSLSLSLSLSFGRSMFSRYIARFNDRPNCTLVSEIVVPCFRSG